MFQRVQFPDWQTAAAVAVTLLSLAAFLYLCWRALRMSRDDRRRIARLPLASEQPEPARHEPTERTKG